MSAITSAVIGATGSVASAVVAANASNKATKAYERAETARLDFSKEQLNEYKETFGGIEKGLSDYFEHLTPEAYTARSLVALNGRLTQARQHLEESFAARGLTESGVHYGAQVQLETDASVNAARVRAEAPRQVAAEKLGFLQYGLGKFQVANASQADTLNQRTAVRGGIAQQAAGAAGGAIGNAIGAVGNSIGDIVRLKTKKPPTIPSVLTPPVQRPITPRTPNKDPVSGNYR